MKLLIAVQSCQRDRKLHNLRGKTLNGAETRYFFGGPYVSDLKPYEVWLDQPDGYIDIPFKLWAIYRYALDNGYDFCLKCDNDARLTQGVMESGFWGYDWCGDFAGGKLGAFASGGANILSRKAMEIVLSGNPRKGPDDNLVFCALRPAYVRGEITAMQMSAGVWTYDYMETPTHCKTCLKLLTPFDGDRPVCAEHDYSREGFVAVKVAKGPGSMTGGTYRLMRRETAIRLTESGLAMPVDPKDLYRK